MKFNNRTKDSSQKNDKITMSTWTKTNEITEREPHLSSKREARIRINESAGDNSSIISRRNQITSKLKTRIYFAYRLWPLRARPSPPLSRVRSLFERPLILSGRNLIIARAAPVSPAANSRRRRQIYSTFLRLHYPPN